MEGTLDSAQCNPHHDISFCSSFRLHTIHPPSGQPQCYPELRLVHDFPVLFLSRCREMRTPRSTLSGMDVSLLHCDVQMSLMCSNPWSDYILPSFATIYWGGGSQVSTLKRLSSVCCLIAYTQCCTFWR
ncbi:hypothetical protein EI94DRAFT_1717088, partial [Lactarius quietus]